MDRAHRICTEDYGGSDIWFSAYRGLMEGDRQRGVSYESELAELLKSCGEVDTASMEAPCRACAEALLAAVYAE